MFRDELMSTLVAGQKPIGYTHSYSIGKKSSEEVRKYALMFHDLFPIFAEASKNKGFNKLGLLFGLTMSQNFKDLFYKSLRYIEGAEVDSTDVNKVIFSNNKLRKEFLNNIVLKDIPQKPLYHFTLSFGKRKNKSF